MNRSAILHIPMSQYAFAEAEDVFTVRLRAAKGDLSSCTLFFGDRACIQSPVVFEETPMEAVWQDEYYDYFEK
ncbi:MAG: alpha amylase N-terminal ig-like domain-containing protein, partial [Lachnospiraceae bacterium]|nr:alpha amylase N-terminal ig-like domain-containing protein [Lachnospiraceae bacterium]